MTTILGLAPDKPLRAISEQRRLATGALAWRLGCGSAKGAWTRDPYARRNYRDGAQPFERLKRSEKPTTFIDEKRVARVPKRTDMFARSLFGDMGKPNAEKLVGGRSITRQKPVDDISIGCRIAHGSRSFRTCAKGVVWLRSAATGLRTQDSFHKSQCKSIGKSSALLYITPLIFSRGNRARLAVRRLSLEKSNLDLSGPRTGLANVVAISASA